MSRRAVGRFATLMLLCVFGCGSEEEPAVTLPDDSGSDEEVVILPKPVILDVAVAATTRTEAVIRWTTDVPGTSHVEYGVTSAYGSRTQIDWRFVTEHEATLARSRVHGIECVAVPQACVERCGRFWALSRGLEGCTRFHELMQNVLASARHTTSALRRCAR
jgi:hypothetical protein